MTNSNIKIEINKAFYSLEDIESLAWRKLVNGAVKKKNGFRSMFVATINNNGEASIRTVVNRKADEFDKKIYFHTDIRSRKIESLQRDNRISLLFYDAKQRIQIAIKANVVLHVNNDLQKNRWQATSSQARLGYMTIDAPNTKSDDPTLGYNEKFATNKPSDAESNVFKENFVVVECQVYELEFLYLDYLGNRKANYFYKNGTMIDCFWAVP